MGYYKACTSTMNLSINSLKSDICLDSRNFDFSSLPSFDKINTFWQSTPGARAPNGQAAGSKLDAMQKLLSAKQAAPDQSLTKEVPSAEPANEASPKAAPAKKDDAADEEYNPNFNMSKSKKEKRPLPKEFKPSAFSVICGRTQNCYNSTGNRRFRVTVKLFLQDYMEAEGKSEKSAVVSRVMEMIEKAAAPEGGAFVTHQNGRWYEVSDRVKREKIGGLFRDLLHTQYKSSAKSKQAKKVARQQTQEEQEQQMEVYSSAMNQPQVYQQQQQQFVEYGNSNTRNMGMVIPEMTSSYIGGTGPLNNYLTSFAANGSNWNAANGSTAAFARAGSPHVINSTIQEAPAPLPSIPGHLFQAPQPQQQRLFQRQRSQQQFQWDTNKESYSNLEMLFQSGGFNSSSNFSSV